MWAFGPFGPRPLNWAEALTEQAIDRLRGSDEWRQEFAGLVLTRFYEIVHTDCQSKCACMRERALHSQRGTSA
jgi:hypothetical protein